MLKLLDSQVSFLCFLWWGLEGDEVVNFVYKQQELYRDKRAAERAALGNGADTANESAIRAEEALERDKVTENEIRVLELWGPGDNVDQSLADAAMRPKMS